MKFFIMFLLIFSNMFADVLKHYYIDENGQKTAVYGYCYSILTKVGKFTPVNINYFSKTYTNTEYDTLFNQTLFFNSNKLAYVGCYKKKETAEKKLYTLKFNFKNPKIVYHQINDGIPYVILPGYPKLNLKKALEHLHYIYKNYTIKKVMEKFPSRFYGSGIKLYDIRKIDFLPSINLYSFYHFNGDQKVLILYDGVYSLEYLYKKLHNPSLISKIDNNTYEINVPIVVSSTASLVMKNKTIRLQTLPHPVFIMYFGNLYIANSKILTWDNTKNRFAPRQKVPLDKILYTNYEKPRPYILGLSGSKCFFVNNIFRGLGFHSTSATFGLAVLYPIGKDFYSLSQGFYYYLRSLGHPTGAYIGNDMYDQTMAIYSNGGRNVVYLGNYAHDNIIYDFDPHDYSKGLVIARNLATRAGHAHGIIFSRGCVGNYIAENLSIKNHSNGIMLDRLSNYNLIYKNLTIGNGYMGISLIESRNNLIKNNISVENFIDGIMVRNNLNIQIDNNIIKGNGKNGIEVMVKNIDDIPGRNFARDPYFKAASVIISRNYIKNNFNSNIMVKHAPAVKLINNYIPNYMGLDGDINFFYNKIIAKKGNFTLYGLGYPIRAESTDEMELTGAAYEIAKKIFIDISNNGNDYTPTLLGGLYINRESPLLVKSEFERAATLFSRGALMFLGYFYLTKAQKEHFKYKKNIVEGFSYLIENAILTHNIINYNDILETIFFVPDGKFYIQKAFRIAVNRMKNGLLFDKENYKKCPLCKESLNEKFKILSAFRIFNYKFNEIKAKTFYEYAKQITKNYTIFTPLTMRYFSNIIKEKNKVKENVNIYSKKIYNLIHKNPSYRNYFKNQQKDIQTTKSLINLEKQRILKYLRPKIKNLLKKINEYRIRKISMDTVLKILNRGTDNIIEDIYMQGR